MIYWFSGTGNSRYFAEKIAEVTGEGLVCLNDKIKKHESTTIETCERVIIAAPTYAWRIPRVVQSWLRETTFPLGCRIWFVMTCGSEIGNAATYNAELAAEKKLTYMGTAGVAMPENYIAMFNAPAPDKAKEIIAKAEPKMLAVAELIRDGKELPKPRCNPYDRFVSGPVNKYFYKKAIKADPFWATEKCTGCGACVELCPLNNITLKDGKPSWGKTCTHCMACICRCPSEAIEYGKKSKGKPRYHI